MRPLVVVFHLNENRAVAVLAAKCSSLFPKQLTVSVGVYKHISHINFTTVIIYQCCFKGCCVSPQVAKKMLL